MTNFSDIELANKVALKVAKVKITSSQLLTMNATPITLVPAPSSTERGDVMLEFLGAVVHKPAGTAYAVATGEDIAIKYTDGSGAQVNTSLETTGFLDAATAQTRITRPIVTEYTPVANAALVAHVLSGEVATGTSDLYVTVHYREWRDTTVEPS